MVSADLSLSSLFNVKGKIGKQTDFTESRNVFLNDPQLSLPAVVPVLVRWWRPASLKTVQTCTLPPGKRSHFRKFVLRRFLLSRDTELLYDDGFLQAVADIKKVATGRVAYIVADISVRVLFSGMRLLIDEFSPVKSWVWRAHSGIPKARVKTSRSNQ